MNKSEIIDFESKIKLYINKYGSLNMSKKEFYKYLNKPEFFGIYLKNKSAITAAEKLRSLVIKDRQLEVLYITGCSGSGKTTLAKALAERKHYDYFVSGSGEDFLDGYDKEECIILDDFRGGSMRFSELLKFLDNNTNSSVRSRYYNKDISNCKLIIITSVLEPKDLYSMFSEEGSEEPIEQLYRRLKHHLLKIDDSTKEIEEYKLLADSPILKTGNTLGNMSDIYAELGITPDIQDDTSIISEWLKPMGNDESHGIDYRKGENIF